jgi:hypothetical protein
MKNLLLLPLVLLSFVSVFSQQEMLTKQETVNYLNKKVKEAEGVAEKTTTSKFIRRYTNLSVQLKGGDVVLEYTSRLWREDGTPSASGPTRYTYSFNPAYIKDFVVDSDAAPGSQVKRLTVAFSAATVRKKLDYTQLEPDNTLYYLPFFASVPENESRIRKALLHLRDLAKAEDDPFGN